MLRTLNSKISVTMWILAAASTLIAAVLSGSLLVKSHRDSVQRQLQATGSSLLALGISDYSELEDFERISGFIEGALQMDKVSTIVRIYDASRKLIFTTVGSELDRLQKELVIPVVKPSFILLHGEHRDYESLVIPYEGGRGKKKLFYLHLAIPLPKYGQVLHDFWIPFLIFFALLMFLSFLLSQWLTARLLRPVRAIADDLKRMEPLDIATWRRVPNVEGEYLGPITQGINLLIDKTQQAFDQLHRMSRYVAHELRTPLTIIRGEAEVVLAKPTAAKEDYQMVMMSSLEEVHRMSDIVSTILHLGDPKNPQIHPQRFDLWKWLGDHRPLWERTLAREIELYTDLVPPHTVFTDPKLLFRLVDNFVRNVKKHTNPDVRCQMTLEGNADGLLLHVRDQGRGLRPVLIAALNAGEMTALQSGVGLHLCQRIATACDIGLQFSNHMAGGLDVALQLKRNEAALPLSERAP